MQGPLNVILISLDTVRPDHLSCYDYHRQTTPNIDRIAKERVRFANAFSQTSSTHPSHLSIFTSRYPTRQWVNWEGNDMDVSVETLTESLRRAGDFTAAFTGLSEANENHRGLLASRPFQAFDQMNQGVSLRALPGKLWSERVRHRHQPFFFFVHGFDAHGPHILPLKYEATRFNPHYHGPLASTHFELWESASSSPDELAQLPLFQRYSFECTRHLEQLGASDHVDAAFASPAGALRRPALLPRSRSRRIIPGAEESQSHGTNRLGNPVRPWRGLWGARVVRGSWALL